MFTGSSCRLSIPSVREFTRWIFWRSWESAAFGLAPISGNLRKCRSCRCMTRGLRESWSISMAIERRPKHGEEGYEHADTDVRSIYHFGVALAILILAVMWAMVHTYNFFAKHESLGPPASPFENRRPLPPQPRLQPNPRTDLKSYCE